MLMGSDFEITVVAPDSAAADKHITNAVNEMERIEKLISSWDPDSQTSEINRNAGKKAVLVDRELFELIERALGLSQLTDGAFDITYASMDHIWQFDGSMQKMPNSEEVKASVAKVGYKNVELDKINSAVYLKRSGMKIGFGAIGKGYAADRAKKLLRDMGVSSGIINASGDITAWGLQPNGAPWKVAITNPMDKQKAYGTLPVTEGAVVTSGNYEKYVVFNGKRYSHIIDPRTGYPSNGLVSVTVFAPKAELADALATSIFVMGKTVGLNRIAQIPGVSCIIIDDKGTLFASEEIEIAKL